MPIYMSSIKGAAVRFEKVQKSYDGENLVVKDFNLDIAPGEFLTMLGPSGSGKTTCLMMLAGFEPATHGEIFLNDRPINNVPPYKRGIGMVFQNYALFPHMSVAENLAFPLQIRKMSQGRPGRPRSSARLKWSSWAHLAIVVRHNCPADSSSALPLPVHWCSIRNWS